MSELNNLRMRVINDIATERDNFILRMFARHGYSRWTVNSLITEDRISIICTPNSKTFTIDNEPIFRMNTHMHSHGRGYSYSFNVEEVCEDIHKPLKIEGNGITLREFLKEYDFEPDEIIVVSRNDVTVPFSLEWRDFDYAILSVDGNIVTVR